MNEEMLKKSNMFNNKKSLEESLNEKTKNLSTNVSK